MLYIRNRIDGCFLGVMLYKMTKNARFFNKHIIIWINSVMVWEWVSDRTCSQ